VREDHKISIKKSRLSSHTTCWNFGVKRNERSVAGAFSSAGTTICGATHRPRDFVKCTKKQMFYRGRQPASDCPLTSEMQSAALSFFKVNTWNERGEHTCQRNIFIDNFRRSDCNSFPIPCKEKI